MEKLISHQQHHNLHVSPEGASSSLSKQQTNAALLKDMMRLSQLHHYVSPENHHELRAIHQEAQSTALIYLSTIGGLYLIGLVLILIHYMNSSYGKWTWTLRDVWDEIKPFFWNSSSEKSSDSSEEKSEEGGGFELGPELEECLHHRSKSVFAGQPPSAAVPSKCLARRLLSHSPFQQGSKPSKEAQEMVHNNGNTSSTSNKPNTMVSNCTLISSSQGEKSKEKNNDIVAIDLVQFKYQAQQ